MIALRWHAKEDVRLDDVDLRLPLGPEMVEVAVSWCGICGSDLAEYLHGPFAIRPRPHALTGQQPPITLGHELAGVVTAVGSEVVGLAPGDRVAADACWRCERCAACRAGQYNLCPQGGSIGLASDGGFASHVRFPAYCAVPLPDAVSDQAGALLEPLAVGLHALDRGGARAGDTVVVLGFGPIGAATALVGEAIGLNVLVGELHAGRRARATAMGFDAFSPAGETRDVTRDVRARTGGGARIVVDCTGAASALDAAPDMTVRGGTVVLVGLPKQPLAVDMARLVLYERRLVASLGYVHDLERVADLIDTGALDPTPMVTTTADLRDAPAMFARLTSDPGDDLKILIAPEAA